LSFNGVLLFPEFKPYLEDVQELAEPGAEYIITRYRDADQNLRTQLGRIVERAGLDLWPKLFQNLRSTRQNELEEDYPSHVVCYWIGNSEKVANKHYLQVTSDHFARALRKAVQNPVQHSAATSENALQPESENPEIPGTCNVLHARTFDPVAGAGLEPAQG
jgi:hypothetical protein